MLVDEEDGNILTFRERLESILNRRYLSFWRPVLVGSKGLGPMNLTGVDDEEILLVLLVYVADPRQE